jgi:hypothetical protein
MLTALHVASAYIAYHAAENYFIVPIVYGNKRRLRIPLLSAFGFAVMWGQT